MAKRIQKEPDPSLVSFMEHSPYSMWISDEKGTLIQLNQAFRDLFRVQDDEVVGKYNIFRDEVVKGRGLQPVIKKVYESGETARFYFEYDTSRLEGLDLKKRVSLVLDVTIIPIFDGRGKVKHAISQQIDITVSKRAEELLRESESKYRSIFETTGAATVIVEEDMTISLTNSELGKVTGYSREEIEGKKKWTDFIVKEDLERMKAHHYSRRNDPDSAPRSYEVRIRDRQGSIKDVLLTVSLVPGTKKSVASILDISERKRAEEALRESEERWQFALEGAGDGVWDWNPETNKVYFSRQWKAMLGHEESEIGDSLDEWAKRVHPDDYPGALADLDKHFKGESPLYINEHRLLCKNGTYKWILDRGKVIRRTEEGKPLRVIGTHTDITERKRAEETLRESEERWQFALEGAGDGVWDWNPETNKIHYSRRCKEMLGYEESEFGNSLDEWAKRVHPDDYPGVMAEIDKHFKGESPAYINEHRLLCKGGAYKWVLVRGKAIRRTEDGKPLRVIGTRTDISERKRAEEALRESEESALRLARENAVMAEIGRIIGSTPNIDEVYKFFAEKVKGLLSYDRMIINLIDKDGFTLLERYVEGKPVPGRGVGEVFPMAGTLTEKVIQSRKGFLFDIQDENEVAAIFPGLVPEMKTGLRSFLSVPLISGDQPIGGLHFRSKQSGFYSEKDLRLAESIANQIAGAIANAQLYLERKRAEEGLRESEQKLMAILRGSPIPAFVISKDHRVMHWNKALKEMSGIEPGEVIGTDRHWKAFYGEKRPCMADLLVDELVGMIPQWYAGKYTASKFAEGGYEAIDFFPGLGQEGKWLRFTAAAIRDSQGNLIGAIETLEDITERKRAEGALRESEERYRRLVENSPLGIISVDAKGAVIHVNPQMVSILGVPSASDIQGISIYSFFPLMESGVSAKFRHCMESGEPGAFEGVYRGTKGEETYLRYHFTPIRDSEEKITGIQAVVEDVTERKHLEDQLAQAQKMEAIGTLAGGIAHDFNNILSGIMGYAELAGLDIPKGSKADQNLQNSLKSAQRAKNLVQQILAFSRQSKQERKPMDIGPVIKEGLKLLRTSLPSTIEIRQNLEGDLGSIVADPTQIHQVLMNLCTNASHAMSEKGGILEVSLGNVDMKEELSTSLAGIEPGPYLRLRVSDTGHGIPPEILPKIYDPYFTTKKVGKGTGLGLAVVNGIVKSYGGGITVSSEIGRGTAFDVYFPRVEAPSAALKAEKIEPLPLGSQERVLFVDDEEMVAEIGQKTLTFLGYKVDVRTSSLDALELFRAKANEFDLVITDMTMPNLTGDKLAQQLLKIRPEIPVILCTGFSEQITEEKAKAIGIREFVLKPLVMKDLARAIRNALESRKKRKD